MVDTIRVGDKAPDFILKDAESRTRQLKEFLGQKVVLVFFVGAFTTECTKEICVFRDSMARLIDLKAQIVGIDVNVPISNKVLAVKNKLPFPILSDYKREVLETYGLEVTDYPGRQGQFVACCWGSGCYPIAKRSIFILDETGIVRLKWVSNNPSDEPNYDEIRKVLEQKAPDEQVAKIAPNVVTISKQEGSGGDEVAIKVSQILGYSYFDKSLMLSEAKSLGISEEDIADFSEDEYKVKSFVDKISLRKRPVVMPSNVKDSAAVTKTLDEEECLSAIQAVINSLASRGKTVIVGRGGQAILKHKVGVLHIRIIAPETLRVERIMKSRGLNRETALKLIKDNDQAAAEYLRRFYNINWEDPELYDLVLNTGKIDFDRAARVISSATSQP
ncbi:MAG TPA: cytidylate kinase family protein [Candidatus Acidoferrum sp.]|nr:cytidylate kinase family protein [Candidatus Acidoferrum sp.]